jgi:hypothetical protein
MVDHLIIISTQLIVHYVELVEDAVLNRIVDEFLALLDKASISLDVL